MKICYLPEMIKSELSFKIITLCYNKFLPKIYSIFYTRLNRNTTNMYTASRYRGIRYCMRIQNILLRMQLSGEA
jgi:hypothetical protein